MAQGNIKVFGAQRKELNRTGKLRLMSSLNKVTKYISFKRTV